MSEAANMLSTGFNGAATFRSRKVDKMVLHNRNVEALQWGRDLSVAEGHVCIGRGGGQAMLQWGRDLSVAEGQAPRQKAPRRQLGFNGAATFRSRKEVYLREGGGEGDRFNGAATFRSRKDSGCAWP